MNTIAGEEVGDRVFQTKNYFHSFWFKIASKFKILQLYAFISIAQMIMIRLSFLNSMNKMSQIFHY